MKTLGFLISLILSFSVFAGTVSESGPTNITLTPVDASNTGTLKFRELGANGVNYVALRAPDSIAGNVTWKLPSTDGTNGQVWTTNGSGVFSWGTPILGGSNNTFTGTNTFSNYISLELITPAQLTANVNDWDTGAASYIRASSDASRNITGIANGVNGRLLILANVGSSPIVLQHQNGGSLAANRIISPSAGDITLSANFAATIVYDATDTKWRIISIYQTSGGGAVGGSGTGGLAARWSGVGASTTLTDSVIRDNGSTIGILKASSASYALDVLGKINASDIISATHNSGVRAVSTTANADTMAMAPNVTGAGTFIGTLTPADLTASHTWTFPNTTGTVALLEAANIFTTTNTFPNTGLKIFDTGGDHTLTLTTNQNLAANRTVTFPATLDATVAYIDSAQTYTSNRTFNNTVLRIRDTGNDHTVILSPAGDEAADRTLNIPLLGGTDTIATLGVANTFTGANIFQSSSGIQSLYDGGANDDILRLLPVDGGAGRFTGSLTHADLTANKTWTFPDTTGTVVTTGDTGTVATAMVASNAITGAKLATNVSQLGKNKLINGSFNIWQRYPAGLSPITATGTYTADRWVQRFANTGGRIGVTPDTTIKPTEAFSGNTASAVYQSMKIACTTADATVGATDISYLEYSGIEGYDFQPLHKGQTVTLSFWFKTNKTTSGGNRYCVYFTNSAKNRFYVSEFESTTTDWEKKVITLTTDTGGTWLLESSAGMIIGFPLIIGADNDNATADTWNNSSSAYCTANQINFLDANTNVCYVSQIQLEIGSTATDYEHVHFSLDLKRCERYYEKTYQTDIKPGTGTASGGAVQSANAIVFTITDADANENAFTWLYKTRKRLDGSVQIYGWATGGTGGIESTTGTGYGGFTTYVQGNQCIAFRNSSGGLTTGITMLFQGTVDADY